MHLRDATDQEVTKLTQILQLLPTDDAITYSRRILSETKRLPTDLKRRGRASRLLHLSAKQADSVLCALHKPLNACITNSLFTRISLEVGVRLNSLVCHNLVLTADQWRCVAILRQLHALWLGPVVYEKTLGQPAATSQWSFQRDHCEACMLSRIAGDMDALLALRLVLLSRQRTKGKKAARPLELSRWVEAWIVSLMTRGVEMAASRTEIDMVLLRNFQEAQELKVLRKQLKSAKRAEREASSKKEIETKMMTEERLDLESQEQDGHQRLPPFEWEEEREGGGNLDGASESDFENPIIDHYAALLSTEHVPRYPDAHVSYVKSRTNFPLHTLATVYRPGDATMTLSSTSTPVSPISSEQQHQQQRSNTPPSPEPQQYITPRSEWKTPLPDGNGNYNNAYSHTITPHLPTQTYYSAPPPIPTSNTPLFTGYGMPAAATTAPTSSVLSLGSSVWTNASIPPSTSSGLAFVSGSRDLPRFRADQVRRYEARHVQQEPEPEQKQEPEFEEEVELEIEMADGRPSRVASSEYSSHHSDGNDVSNEGRNLQGEEDRNSAQERWRRAKKIQQSLYDEKAIMRSDSRRGGWKGQEEKVEDETDERRKVRLGEQSKSSSVLTTWGMVTDWAKGMGSGKGQDKGKKG